MSGLITKKDKCPISNCEERSSGCCADDQGNYRSSPHANLPSGMSRCWVIMLAFDERGNRLRASKIEDLDPVVARGSDHERNRNPADGMSGQPAVGLPAADQVVPSGPLAARFRASRGE
jgi:hypothetical protein